jgi:hypothetical protein
MHGIFTFIYTLAGVRGPALMGWKLYTLMIQCFPGKCGELVWNNNWISFLDTMLQMSILRLSGNSLCLPTRIKSVTVNPLLHGKNVYTNGSDQSGKENSCSIFLFYLHTIH